MTTHNDEQFTSGWHGAMDRLKAEVIKAQGDEVDENKKFEIAEELGIPLTRGYNGELTAKQAGQIGGPMGGPIGGNMVKEMVRMAQEQMAKKQT